MIETIIHEGYKLIFWLGDCGCKDLPRKTFTPYYTLDGVLDQYNLNKVDHMTYWSIHHNNKHLLSVKDNY